jgi:FkbM family methyltransferase
VVDGKLTYQYRKLEAAMNRIPVNAVAHCIDIGAHVGLWAMWLVKEFQHVHCFEPIAHHRDILPAQHAQRQLHGLPDRVGRYGRDRRSSVPQRVTGNAHVVLPGQKHPPDYANEPVEENIPMTTLDSLEFYSPIDFIKIDVEGFELQVVRGAEKTLRATSPVHGPRAERQRPEVLGATQASGARLLPESIGMRPKQEIGGDWLIGW